MAEKSPEVKENNFQDLIDAMDSSRVVRYGYALTRIRDVIYIIVIFIGSAIFLFGAPILFMISVTNAIWLLVVAVIAALQIVFSGMIIKSIAAEVGIIEGEVIPEAESLLQPQIQSPIWFRFPIRIEQGEIKPVLPVGHRTPDEYLEDVKEEYSKILGIYDLFPGSTIQSKLFYMLGLWITLTLINWTVISAPYLIGFLDPIFVGSIEVIDLYNNGRINNEYIGFYLVAIPILLGEIVAVGVRSWADIRGWTSDLHTGSNREVDIFWTQTNIRTVIELSTFTIVSWMLINGMIVAFVSFSPSAPVYMSYLAGWGIVVTKHIIDIHVTTFHPPYSNETQQS